MSSISPLISLYLGPVIPFVSLRKGSCANIPSHACIYNLPLYLNFMTWPNVHPNPCISVPERYCLCRCGSTRRVCTDVIFQSSERAVGDRERMLDLLQRWGQHRAEVRFFLRHNRAPREPGKLPIFFCTHKSFLFFFSLSLSQKVPFKDLMHCSSCRGCLHPL